MSYHVNAYKKKNCHVCIDNLSFSNRSIKSSYLNVRARANCPSAHQPKTGTRPMDAISKAAKLDIKKKNAHLEALF